MNFALTYLIERAGYRILNFFHHWYVDGSRRLFHSFLSFFERMDEIFAVRITFKYFFHPLYKDYSIVGRIVGIVFRTLRIALGAVVYVVVGIVFLGIYLLWVLIPVFIVLYIARSLMTGGMFRR